MTPSSGGRREANEGACSFERISYLPDVVLNYIAGEEKRQMFRAQTAKV